ncbi:MAG: hypothetical protein KatS3mg040_1804 [Candidatus Kapaibacterium sp.]|nr:MAG: hypothetical protein KatS3mg040_1804 [Candidatus Kapabacteria bacterium]
MHDEIPNKYTYFYLVTTSEKMFMRSLLALLAFVTGAVFLSCSSDPSPTASGENHPPVIDSIVVAGAAIVGQPVTVTCYARDPDGDELSYFWRASDGDILGSGAQVTFLPAPCCSGLSATLEVAVHDGRGGQDRRLFTVFVL